MRALNATDRLRRLAAARGRPAMLPLAMAHTTAAGAPSAAPSSAPASTKQRSTTGAYIISNTERCKEALLNAVIKGRVRQQPVAQRTAPATVYKHHGAVITELCQESLTLSTEPGPQGSVPLLIITAANNREAGKRLPAVVFLHGTGSDKNALRPLMQEYAAAGYLAAAMDCRYHGARCLPMHGQSARDAYQDALIRAWRGDSDEHPFLLDNVWDLLHVLDYLSDRQDVDPQRIGMTGISLGGMHTWLCATIDTRVAVAAPLLGVQNWGWAVENHHFHGRVESVPKLFKAAASDLGKHTVDADVVMAVWERLLPGLELYDTPHSLPCIAPRPLLIANGALDHRCPMDGVHEALVAARQAYDAAGVPERLCLLAEDGIGHQRTPAMDAAIRRWFDDHLLLQAPTVAGGTS